jgi:hypothetical protein
VVVLAEVKVVPVVVLDDTVVAVMLEPVLEVAVAEVAVAVVELEVDVSSVHCTKPSGHTNVPAGRDGLID